MKIKYHILAASFILSGLLWLSLNLNQTYEIQRNIPVHLTVEKPYAVANPVPLTLDVKLKGIGWNLLRLFTSLKVDFTYDVNVSSGRNVVLTRQYLADNLGLGQSFNITSVRPESLFVTIGKYEEKYVKIIPRIYVKCIEGYQTVGQPVLSPDSIKIGGAVEIIKNLNHIYTQDLVFKNVNSNISDAIRLSDSLSNILWHSQEDVRIFVKVELTADKQFQDVPLKVSGIPSDKDVMLIPQSIELQLKGGVEQLAKLDNTKIYANLNYSDLLADTTGAVIPKYTLPEGVIIIFSKPDKIQYIIKKKS